MGERIYMRLPVNNPAKHKQIVDGNAAFSDVGDGAKPPAQDRRNKRYVFGPGN